MSDDPNLNQGIGGGPLPPLGGGPSLAEEEAALQKGNKGVLIAGVVAALLVSIGLGFVLVSGGGDDSEQYGAIGRQINGMKQEHFDGFWACALPGENLSDLRSDQDLRRAIHDRARRAPARYASHIRQECIVKLNEHEPGLRALIAPEDLQTQLTDLTTALVELRDGWNDYARALEQVSETYDEDEQSARINKIAKGWYDYKRAYGAVNDTIRGHITE